LILLTHPADHVERVGVRKHPDAHERRRLSVEADIVLVAFSAEHHVGDLAEPDDDAVLLLNDELAKLFRRAQIGVGDQIHRHHSAFRPPERRQVIVPR